MGFLITQVSFSDLVLLQYADVFLDATITVSASPSVHVNGKESKDQTFSPKRTRDEVSDVPDAKHDIIQRESAFECLVMRADSTA